MKATLVSNSSNDLHLLRAATGIFLFVVVTVILSAVSNISILYVIFWGIMLSCIIAPIWLNPEVRQQAFHPYSYFIFQGVVIFCIPGLLVLIANPEGAPTEQFPQATLLVGGAFLGYWLGFQSKLGGRLARTVPLLVFNRARSGRMGAGFWITALLLYLVGWYARLLSAAIGFTHLPIDLGEAWRYKSLLSDFVSFATLSYVLMLYNLLRAYRERPVLLIFIATLVLLEIMGGTLYGGRTAIILPLLILIVVYHFAVQHIRWRTLMIGYVLAFVIFAPLLTLYRGAYYSQLRNDSKASFETVSSSLGAIVDEMSSAEFDWQTVLNVNVFESGTFIFIGTLKVVDSVPSTHDHQLGDTFIPGLLSIFTPRLISPDKPIYQPGRDFAITFWDKETEDVFGTSIAIGMPAEAYYNFSWFGLFMFPLLGLFLRFLYERFKVYERLEATYVLRALFMLFVIANFEAPFFFYFSGAIRAGLVYLLFMTIINRQLPQLRMAARA